MSTYLILIKYFSGMSSHCKEKKYNLRVLNVLVNLKDSRNVKQINMA